MTVSIEFDRGTVLCRGVRREAVFEGLPGLRWDARVDCHRAPARHYARILARLESTGTGVEDRVRASTALPSPARAPRLRPYQAAAIDAWRLAGRRGLVALPTGSGKTFVAAAAIASTARSTLCLVPTRILLEQWHEVLTRTLEIDVGRYGDGVRESRPVTVATFESAWRHMQRLGNRFDLLVIDEVHHFGSGSRTEALEMSTAPWRLGLTATPPADTALQKLAELCGPLTYELSIGDLVGSYLADFELIDLRLDLTPEERKEYDTTWAAYTEVADDFRDRVPDASWQNFLRWASRTPKGRAAIAAWHRARKLLAFTQAKRAMVASLLARHEKSRVLIFTSDKEAAYAISRAHLVMPVTADIKRREREEMLRAFRDGDIRALVSARVLNEGFDVPEADVGIVVGGALGEREHVQRVGRLLRPSPGKRAIIYELVTRGTPEVPQARRKRRGLESGRRGSL